MQRVSRSRCDTSYCTPDRSECHFLPRASAPTTTTSDSDEDVDDNGNGDYDEYGHGDAICDNKNDDEAFVQNEENDGDYDDHYFTADDDAVAAVDDDCDNDETEGISKLMN